MAIAEEEPSVGKAGASSGQWVEITMKKVQRVLSMTDNDERKHVLDYTHVDLHYMEDQRKNLLNKFNLLNQELASHKSKLCNLKNTVSINCSLQNEIIRVNLEKESLKDKISDLKKVIEKWTCSKVTLDQLLFKQVTSNIVQVLGGRGKRKGIFSSKEVIFTKANESSSEPAPKITSESESECDTQEPLPPLPKLIGAKPFGTSYSLLSLANLTLNMADLTLNTTVPKKAKQSADKVSPAYVIKKKTEIKAPSVLESCSNKKADSSTEQLFLTLMEEAQSPLNPLSKKVPRIPKPFSDCKYYGFNDHHSDNYEYYPGCKICGSIAHETADYTMKHLDSRKPRISLNSCSRHMTGVKQYLHRYSKESGPKVVFGDNSLGDTEGYNGITFTRVSYVNGMKHNLISISQLCDANFKVMFTKTQGPYSTKTMKLFSLLQGEETYMSLLEEFCDENGISQNFSSPCTPKQNGVAKRRNITLIEAARTMLNSANLPKQFWGEAVNTACYTQNRSIIVKRHGKTAYDVFRGRSPDISYFYEFWYMAEADSTTNIITFTLSNFDKPLSFDLDVFSTVIGLKRSEKFVSLPPKETVKAGLATLGLIDENDTSLSFYDLVNSSPLKMRYFSLKWRVLMQYIVKCLGGMQGYHDQLNVNQQIIAYCLCWGLDIDIANILFSDLINEVPLMTHICKVAKLSPEPIKSLIHSSEDVNTDDTSDKSLSGTTLQLVTQSKAPTDKKTKRKRISTSTKPEPLKTVREYPPKEQATDSQPAKEPMVTVDITHSLGTSELAEEQGNQPKTTEAKKVHEHIIDEEVKGAGLCFMGDVPFEQLMDEYDQKQSTIQEMHECPYDTESKIKVVKRFQPHQTNDEDQITFLGPIYDELDQRVEKPTDSNLHSMLDDEVESISGFEAADSNEEGTKNTEPKVTLTQSEEATADNIPNEMADLKASADKPLDPLGHLWAEISSLQ
ncbi:retrovirus-related pol polyprotein from transposon TNT 1-94 [Tanacetum coccineum]